MEPREPAFTAYDADEKPWRIARLVRTDGRVRELFRVATPEAEDAPGSVGERVWSAHVFRLHDERGTLQAHVSAALGSSAWLPVLALVLSRAWGGEDEAEMEFIVEGEPVPWPLAAVLPRL